MDSQFFLEFELNIIEVEKLNKMYFKNLWEERIRIFSSFFLIAIILCDFFFFGTTNDYFMLLIRSLVFVILFLVFQCSFVKTICRLIFQLIKKMLKFNTFIFRYKLNFTNSFISVHSPLGEISHKWSQIEKAILTKDFFLLYIKEKTGYNIISISNKRNKNRNMNELIDFVENKVIHITKI